MDDDDDRLDVVDLLNGGFATCHDDDGGIPVAAIIVAEVMDPETGHPSLRIASSKGLVSWRQAGMALALLEFAKDNLAGDEGDG